MMLYIMLKKCTNACTLQFAGDDFEKATQEAYRLSQRLRVASYVLTLEQVKNIFSKQADKLHDWQLNQRTNEITLSLPLNFKKFLR